MADRYWVGGTGTWDGSTTTNWSASSGGAGGASVPTSADAVIFNASSGGGTVTASGTVNCLTLVTTGFTGTFAGTSTPVIRVHGNAATVVTIANGNVWSVGLLVELVYSGSTGTRTYTGPTSGNSGPRLAVTGGSDTIVIANRCQGMDFTGFTGTLSNSARTLYGHLTLGAGMTVTDGANATTFANLTGAANPYVVTSNGVTFNAPISLSAASWTVQQADALNTGARGITFTTSTSFNTQGFALTTASITSSATGTRTLTFGASTVTLSGSGTVFDMSGASTTVSAASATFICNSASAKTFTGSGKTYGTLTQAGAGALTMGGSTFTTISNSVQPTTIRLTSGTTTTVTNLNLAGTSGNLVTLNALTPGSAATISKASGTVTLSYVSITDVTATGGATFNAFTTSGNVDGGGNTGWNFVSGAEVTPGVATISLAANAPVISTGAIVSVPVASIAFSVSAPVIATGAVIDVPGTSITLDAYAPSVGTVINIDVPVASIAFTTNAPTITTPALTALPRVTMTGRFEVSV